MYKDSDETSSDEWWLDQRNRRVICAHSYRSWPFFSYMKQGEEKKNSFLNLSVCLYSRSSSIIPHHTWHESVSRAFWNLLELFFFGFKIFYTPRLPLDRFLSIHKSTSACLPHHFEWERSCGLSLLKVKGWLIHPLYLTATFTCILFHRDILLLLLLLLLL